MLSLAMRRLLNKKCSDFDNSIFQLYSSVFLLFSNILSNYLQGVSSLMEAAAYRVIHPLVRQVLKMRIWGVPLAGGLLLWLITAPAGPRNLSKNLHQNIANEWMNNAVHGMHIA